MELANRPRVRRPEDRRLAAAGAARPDRGRRPLAGGPGPRRAAVPSLRELRSGGEAGGAGGRRSAGAGDQADALPHQRRFADRPRVGPGRPERQGSDRAGGAEGPLRRMAERQLGAAAGRRRRARDLRHRRLQDARQGPVDRPPRVAAHPPLRPPGHRQLQRPHRPAVLRHRPADLRSRDRLRRGGVLQPADRLFGGRRLVEARRSRRSGCGRSSST